MVRAPHAALASIVGTDHVLTDADQRAGYERDWTGRWNGEAWAVVRPGSTAEVAAVLRWCDGNGTAVVPQGGNTGLVGGSVPRADPLGRPVIVLSLRRLADLGPVDTGALQVTAGAGVTITAWHDHARAAGLDAPIDFAARDSATIGGAIATDAGGSRVLRFGTMRRQVLGVEAVLADGAVVGSLAGLPKETAGLHWPSVLVGSEGTLAVVTRARLRLVPHYRSTATAMVSLRSIDDAVTLLSRLRAGLTSLDAVEVVMPPAVELVAEHIGRAPPIEPAGCVLLIDCAAHHDPTDELLSVLGSAPEVVDSAVTVEPGPRLDLLGFRDRVTEAIAAAATARGTTAFKLDVAVPVGALGRLMAIAGEAAADDGAQLIPFGHLAEGNLHLNHLDVRDPERLADRVLRAVAELGGTISAEHGIGVAKVSRLPLVRSPADLAAQRSLATALDPNRILNPGVLFDVERQVP